MPDGNCTILQLALETRLAPLNSYDAKARTATVVVSAGAPVKRYDWMRERYYLEELVISAEAIDMSRLNGNGLSVLNNHDQWSLEAVLGRASNGRLENRQLLADVRFSQRDEVSGLVRDIGDGIITDVSVGYSRDRMEMVPPDGRNADGSEGLWTYRVTRWTPMEISFVTVPADPAAAMRSSDGERQGEAGKAARTFACEVREIPLAAPAGAESTRKEITMPEGKDPAPATDHSAEAIRAAQEAARKEGEAAAKKRNKEVREVVEAGRAAGLDDEVAKRLLEDDEITVDQVRAKIIDELAQRQQQKSPPVRGTHVAMGESEEVKVRAAIASALFHRLAPGTKLDDNGASEFRGMSLSRLAEDMLERRGVKTRGMNRIELCGRALSTSDFPNVLANVANKRLRQVYDQAPATYRMWARRGPNAPDFKTISVTQVSAAPDFVLKNPGDELKYGSASDGKETYAVATYARGLVFTREAMINDDLNAFDRLVAGFGGSAARLENKLVYLQLLSNPTMGDTVALFHTDHHNISGAAAAISVTTLGAGRAAMRQQTGLQGEVLNVVPAYLIVPSTIEQVAYQFTSNQYVPAQSSNINEFRAGGRTALTPIVDGALDGMTDLSGATVGSASVWYLAADSGQIDTVEYCFLDGYDGVYLDQQIDFDTDAIKMKGRLDFAAKVIDYRGLYRNAA